ncbi:MAG: hypothetical protein ACP5JR_05365 [Thermoplasmata archaeon]
MESRESNGIAVKIPPVSEIHGWREGRINGCNATYKPSKTPHEIKKRNYKKFVVPVIVLVMVSVSLTTLLSIPKEKIVLDGNLSDWESGKQNAFVGGILPAQIDIVKGGLDTDGKWCYFFVEVRGEIFAGDARAGNTGYMDILHIFVDADRNSETGYSIRGLGADYVLNIGGQNGHILVSELYKFDTARERFDWEGKVSYGSIECVNSENTVEIRVQKKLFNSENVAVLYHMFSYDGAEDFADYVVTSDGKVLIAEVSYIGEEIVSGTVPWLKLEMNAPIENVIVEAIVVSERGTNLPVDIGYHVNGGAVQTERFRYSKEIKIGETVGRNKIEIVFYLNVSSLPDETAVGIGINGKDGIKTEGFVNYVEHQDAGKARVAYVRSAPGKVRIDGAFSDWRNKSLSDDGTDGCAPQYDIRKFGALREENVLNLYVSVTDRLLAGIDVPFTGPAKISESSGGALNPPEPVNSTDFVRIYIQKGLPIVGYKICEIIANYMVEIKGKNGIIISKGIYSYNPGNPIEPWAYLDDPPCEIDNYQMEIQIKMEEPSSIVVESTNWKGIRDLAANKSIREVLGVLPVEANVEQDALLPAKTFQSVESIKTEFEILDLPFSNDAPLYSPKLNGSFPSVAVAANGSIYVAYQQNNSDTSHGVFVRKGIEGNTSTWPIQYSKNGTTTDVRNPSICIDPVTQNIYVAYENATFSFLKYTYSSSTWAEYYFPSWDASAWKNPSIAAYNDVVYIFYENESTTYSGKYDIGFVNSTNGGESWRGYYWFDAPTTDERNPSASITAAHVYIAFQNETGGNYNISWYYNTTSVWTGWYTIGTENEEYPSISVSGSYGYVVFQDEYSVTDHDIGCYYSTDGFATVSFKWIGYTSNDELFPSVSAAGSFANVAYINVSGTTAKVSYSNTTDNGQTWCPPMIASDSDGTVRVYPGCLAVTNKTSGCTVWTENSSTANSLTSIYHAEINEKQGILEILPLLLLAPLIFVRRKKRRFRV